MDPDWLDRLISALANEYGPLFDVHGIATLATVDEKGAPRARSVVCRYFDAEVLTIVSDARSRKNSELRRDARAELVFWIADERIQIRIRGTVAVSDGGD